MNQVIAYLYLMNDNWQQIIMHFPPWNIPQKGDILNVQGKDYKVDETEADPFPPNNEWSFIDIFLV